MTQTTTTFFILFLNYPFVGPDSLKNVPGILMTIPCHFTSSQIDGCLVQIEPKFHDYSMSFIQVLFVLHAGTFWKSSSHGISMVFAKKMMGFLSDLVSFSNQTKLPSKRHEKIPVTFFTGHTFLL